MLSMASSTPTKTEIDFSSDANSKPQLNLMHFVSQNIHHFINIFEKIREKIKNIQFTFCFGSMSSHRCRCWCGLGSVDEWYQHEFEVIPLFHASLVLPRIPTLIRFVVVSLLLSWGAPGLGDESHELYFDVMRSTRFAGSASDLDSLPIR
jgi:hypothetical protein